MRQQLGGTLAPNFRVLEVWTNQPSLEAPPVKLVVSPRMGRVYQRGSRALAAAVLGW